MRAGRLRSVARRLCQMGRDEVRSSKTRESPLPLIIIILTRNHVKVRTASRRLFADSFTRPPTASLQSKASSVCNSRKSGVILLPCSKDEGNGENRGKTTQKRRTEMSVPPFFPSLSPFLRVFFSQFLFLVCFVIYFIQVMVERVEIAARRRQGGKKSKLILWQLSINPSHSKNLKRVEIVKSKNNE